jgi:hypothetical protein
MTEILRPVEVELKYRVLDLNAAERYLVAPSIGAFVGASQARSTQMEDRYVDTADHAFERAGFAVRLRASGTGVIVSVKSRSKREGPGGAAAREERGMHSGAAEDFEPAPRNDRAGLFGIAAEVHLRVGRFALRRPLARARYRPAVRIGGEDFREDDEK